MPSNMNAAIRILALVGFLGAVAACGGTSTPTVASPASLSGSVADSIGDPVILPVLRNGVLVVPVVPVPPDLVAATIEVSAGLLTATVSFAPGTLSHTDTFFCIEVDADENAATGSPSAGGDVRLGFDYSICSVNPRGSAVAQISRLSAVLPTATGVGSVPVSFPSADQTRISVPLTLLGNDDGRIAFKVNAMQWVDGPVLNSGEVDWMPDLGRAAGLVR